MSFRVKIQTKNGYKIVDINRRKAIKERCQNCVGFSYAEVNRCEMLDCSLHPFRTGKGYQDSKKRQASIRAYCLWCCLDQPGEVLKCPAMDCALWHYRKGRIDRTVEIDFVQKNNHICANSEAK